MLHWRLLSIADKQYTRSFIVKPYPSNFKIDLHTTSPKFHFRHIYLIYLKTKSTRLTLDIRQMKQKNRSVSMNIWRHHYDANKKTHSDYI